MKWCREHWKLTVAVGVFLVLLVFTLVSYVNQGSDFWLGRRVQGAVAFVQEPVTLGGNAAATTVRGLFQFRSILEENEALKEENARLQKELTEAVLSQQELQELKTLSKSLNYVSPKDGYHYVSATVTAMDPSQWYSTFTINEGSQKGIQKDAVVINADGLVGRVFEVGPNWAKVISIIDEKNDVSFQVFRDLKLLGVLSGDGKGTLTGYMLDDQAPVIKGDTLITSGMELYPQGIPVGKIIEVTKDEDALLQRVKVKTAVNFSNIQKVTVIIAR